jgi:hypothetical protein
MAAKLPSTLPMQAPRGARPSTAAVSLQPLAQAAEVAAQELRGYAQIKAAEADQEAERLLTTFQLEHEPAFQARAAGWDGQAPGFAAREVETYDVGIDGVMAQTSDPEVKLALRRRADAGRASAAARATTFEATRRAEPIRQAAAGQRITQMTAGDIAFNTAYGATVKPIYDSFDGQGEEGLTPRVLAAFDAAVMATEPTVSEAVRPEWRAAMAGRRAKEAAQAFAIEQSARSFATASKAVEQGRTLTNQVLTNPALFSDSLRSIETLGAALPAGEVRERFLTETRGDLVGARMQGLAREKQGERAKAELNSGVYDAWLTPGVKGRLLEAMGRPTVADFLRQGDVGDRADSDVSAAATTGAGNGATSVMEVESELGPAAAAEYQRKMEYARKLYGAVGPLHELSVGAIRERAEALRPDPAAPDYATQQKVFAQFQEAAEREIKTRGEDPAAWAMAQGGGAEASDFLRRKFEAWTSSSGDARPGAAQAYAGATWRRQEQAGVPEGQRRVLPKGVVGALVADMNNSDGNRRAAAIGRAAALFGEFGGFAPQVARELRAGGMSDRDVAAAGLTEGDPGRLSAYVAAVTDPAAVKALPGGDEKALYSAVVRELRPFLASYDALPGGRALQGQRLDAVVLTARRMVVRDGLSAAAAAREAAKIAGDFVYGGPAGAEFRMPARVSAPYEGRTFGFQKVTGADRAALRAARVLREVVKDDGAGLYIAKIAPGDRERRKAAADYVRSRGRWVTTPDDSGLMLMVPGANGTWSPVNDPASKPIRRTWDQLLKGR